MALAGASRGTVPAMEIDGHWVWDSLAIAEMLADQSPELWPADAAARAHARSISAEMHSGFTALRSACPMNVRGRAEHFQISDEVFADIARVQDLLEAALEHFGGEYLYGDQLTIADAFYAPVMFRLQTYAPPAHCELADYSQRLLAHPLLQQWQAMADQDEALAHYDALLKPE